MLSGVVALGGRTMKLRGVFVACVAALGLANCGPRPPVNPPQLVSSNETDLAIQLFIQATIMMAKYYNFETKSYAEISDRSLKAGFNSVPFIPPVTVRATPQINWQIAADNLSTIEFRKMVDTLATAGTTGGQFLAKYYIKTGWKASQIVCRNYLLGLEERNRYLQFLKEELGVGFGMAGVVLDLTSANGTLQQVFRNAQTYTGLGIAAYEKYQFSIDPEAARVLVETAQNKYAFHFMKLVDDPAIQSDVSSSDRKSKYDPKVPFTFSEALSAVSTIEYQCTRSGIAHLLNRSINNTPTNMMIDDLSGTVYFQSSKENTGQDSPAASSSNDNIGVGSINSTNRAIAAAQNAAKEARLAATAARDAAMAAQNSVSSDQAPQPTDKKKGSGRDGANPKVRATSSLAD